MADAALRLLVRVAEPLPSPTTPEELDPSSVSPGLVGFLATFAVAVATVLLVLDMVRRVRRLGFREEQEKRRLAEEERAGRQDDDAGDPPPPVVT